MWQIRHEGSPQAVANMTAEKIAAEMRDGLWEPTDEVLGPQETTWQALENHPQFADLAEDLDVPNPPKHEDATHVDMNALIDVCLVLLIFFILTTSYATTVQKLVPLPVEADATLKGKKIRVVKADEIKKKMIRINASLDSAGKTVVRVENQPVNIAGKDDKTIDGDKLREAIKPHVFQGTGDRKTEVLLDAREVSWSTVIAIQDAAKSAGVQMIHHVMKR